MTSFLDVTLLYFTNFTTVMRFWTTELDFFEIFIRNKVFQRDQTNNLVKYFLKSKSRCLLMTLLVTSLSLISLILPFHRLFEQFNLIFTKYLLRTIFLTWPEEHFSKEFFDDMSHFWLMTSFDGVISLCFTNFTTILPCLAI